MSDIEDDEDDAEPTWRIVGERPFRSWRSSDWGRGLVCLVRREIDSDDLGRRVTVVKGDHTLWIISTWRDQWGTWISGESPIAWELAQEDGTPSFLFALIEALTWLREDDYGTPRLAASGGDGATSGAQGSTIP